MIFFADFLERDGVLMVSYILTYIFYFCGELRADRGCREEGKGKKPGRRNLAGFSALTGVTRINMTNT